MGAIARKREAGRVNYESLRARLVESRLPWDDAAERAAIGALLLAPSEHARKLSRRAYRGHFFDEGHGWLWEDLGTELGRRMDLDVSFPEWSERVARQFRRRFWGSAAQEIAACVKGTYWWHGNWFVDRVLTAAKVRAKIVTASELLDEALVMADEWRLRCTP